MINHSENLKLKDRFIAKKNCKTCSGSGEMSYVPSQFYFPGCRTYKKTCYCVKRKRIKKEEV